MYAIPYIGLTASQILVYHIFDYISILFHFFSRKLYSLPDGIPFYTLATNC